LPQTGIFILEELRDSEEEGGGFIGGEPLSCVEEEGNLSKEDSTSSRLYWRRVEQSCYLALAGC
jgi:hypothetical protein